jgi:capsular exopolysaccharide synthesis family protein
MFHDDLRGPMADVRTFLAQIDNTVDTVTNQTGAMARGGRRAHREAGNHANGRGSPTEHLHYNGEILASAEDRLRGQARRGPRPPSRGMQPDQLRKLTRKWAIPIILVMILGAVASYLVSRRLTPIYQATGRVQVVAAPGNTGSGTLNINSTQATTTAASLITQPKLLQTVIQSLHLSSNANDLSKNVTATAETNTELVDVTVSDPSPALAANIAETLMKAYVTQVTDANQARIDHAGAFILTPIKQANLTLSAQQSQLASELKASQDTTATRAAISATNSLLNQLYLNYTTFQVAEQQGLDSAAVAEDAAVPASPASPKVLLNTVVGGLVALLLASGIAYLVEFLDQGLRRAEDVTERLGLPCLGVIPKFRHVPGRGQSHEPNHRHDEAVREAYRRLRVNLLFATPDENLKSVVITSVRAGEGKTCTAANLAVSLARSERKVLLIDADLRKPDQHRLFGTTLDGGLSELILKTPTVARVQMNGFRQTPFANLSLLTSGAIPPNPAELLASKRAISLLESIGPDQDLVVIDTAPAGLVTDALSIATGASATIIVVEAGKTKASQAAKTIDALREVGANVIGVVLNKTSRRVGAGYSYRYGYAGSAYGQQQGTAGSDGATADDLLPQEEAVSGGETPSGVRAAKDEFAAPIR